MSLFSDLFEGKTSSLGSDIMHAPSSLAAHPAELAETIGGAAAIAAPFALPAIGGALGIGGGADVAAGAGGLSSLFGSGADAAVAGTDALALQAPADAAAANPLADVSALSGGAAPTGDAGASAVSGSSVNYGTALSNLDSSANLVPQNAGDTSFIDRLMAGVKNAPSAAVDQLAKNPLGIAAGAGALGYSILQGQKQLPNQAALNQEAQQLTPQAQQFMSYLQSGTLPAGLQAAVDKASATAKATIIANHARNGQSTDPTQNSALAQELANVDQNALISVAQQGEMLFQAGMSEAQLSANIMQGLMQIEQQQTQSMGKAIANFASALSTGAGGGNQLVLQTGGANA